MLMQSFDTRSGSAPLGPNVCAISCLKCWTWVCIMSDKYNTNPLVHALYETAQLLWQDITNCHRVIGGLCTEVTFIYSNHAVSNAHFPVCWVARLLRT